MSQYQVCEIRVASVITDGGRPELAITLPTEDEASLTEVLGMLELAKDTAIRQRAGGES